jgi:hypothetical protein
MINFIDVIGWYGLIAILTGYFLISYDIIKNGYLYQIINLTGSAAMSWTAFKAYFASGDALPIAILNVVFVSIAITAIIKIGWKDLKNGQIN